MKLSERMRTDRVGAFQAAILDWASEVAQLEAENESLKAIILNCPECARLIQGMFYETQKKALEAGGE